MNKILKSPLLVFYYSRIIIWGVFGLFLVYKVLSTYMYLDENTPQEGGVDRVYFLMKNNSPVLNRSHFESLEASFIDLAKAHYNKGKELIKQKDWGNALREMQQTRKLDSNNQWAWFGEGYALDELGRYAEALTSYNMAIKLASNRAIASMTWNNKGVVLDKLNNREGAFACYNTALAMDPKNEPAQKNWETTLNKLEQIKVFLGVNTDFYPDSSGIPKSQIRHFTAPVEAKATSRSAYIGGIRHLLCQVEHEGRVSEMWVKPKDFEFPQISQGWKGSER